MASYVVFRRKAQQHWACKLTVQSLPCIHKDFLILACRFGWYVWFLVPKTPELCYCFFQAQAVWFCLVSNMFCHTGVISGNRVDHLILMFLSCYKDFPEHSKEACCDPFFATQSNIFSLLNCPAIIKKYGSLGGIWEGEDKAFVRCVKLEILTMCYQTSQLPSVLVKLLKTKASNYLNHWINAKPT